MSSRREDCGDGSVGRKVVVTPQAAHLRDMVADLPRMFAAGEGVLLRDGRNQLRVILWQGRRYVAKSFGIPHLLNRLVYGTLRKSKARRSCEHAALYLAAGVHTPAPVGYVEEKRGLLFGRSWYVCELSRCPLTYDHITDHPDWAPVLRAVGQTVARMHRHRLLHKDLNGGNLLVTPPGQEPRVEVVDLNRLRRGWVCRRTAMRNFDRLPATPRMMEWIMEGYRSVD